MYTNVLLLQGLDTSTHPLDFSRIYPTPPSVESTDEGVATTGLGGMAGGMPYMEEKSGVLEEHLLTVSTCQSSCDIISATVSLNK